MEWEWEWGRREAGLKKLAGTCVRTSSSCDASSRRSMCCIMAHHCLTLSTSSSRSTGLCMLCSASAARGVIMRGLELDKPGAHAPPPFFDTLPTTHRDSTTGAGAGGPATAGDGDEGKACVHGGASVPPTVLPAPAVSSTPWPPPPRVAIWQPLSPSPACLARAMRILRTRGNASSQDGLRRLV